MRVTRKKSRDQPLAEFPGWGLEIMMGLYGEQQVRDALASEALPTQPSTEAGARSVDTPPVAAEAAEFDAVSSVFDRVRRLRRR